MKRWTNLLRGWVTLRVTGANPEGFLNLCSTRGVPFWHLRREGTDTLTLRIPRSRLRQAGQLGIQAGCQVTAEEYRGLPDFLLRFRRRYGFLLGLAVAVAAVGLLSRVVLVIDISGNETVPTAVLMEELENAGLGIGVFTPWANARDIAHRVMLQDSRICYLAVNFHGIRAEVIVREGVEAPEILDLDTPSDLVAGEDGLITGVEVWSGVSLVQAGDVVAKGDRLVSGSLVYTYPDGSVAWEKQVASVATVWARTWHTVGAAAPLTWEEKVYTGAETHRVRLRLGGYTLKFYENSGISYERYDKIVTTKQLILPGGLALPVYWETEICRSYETQPAQLERSAQESRLEALLTQRLGDRLGEADAITSLAFETGEENGWLNVTLNAECLQDIGVQTQLSTEGIESTYD